MNGFIIGVFLTVLTFAVGEVAYTITLTENIYSVGGYLVFGFFTFSPVVFLGLGYAIGRPVSRKPYRKYIGPVRTIRTGETYER